MRILKIIILLHHISKVKSKLLPERFELAQDIERTLSKIVKEIFTENQCLVFYSDKSEFSQLVAESIMKEDVKCVSGVTLTGCEFSYVLIGERLDFVLGFFNRYKPDSRYSLLVVVPGARRIRNLVEIFADSNAVLLDVNHKEILELSPNYLKRRTFTNFGVDEYRSSFSDMMGCDFQGRSLTLAVFECEPFACFEDSECSYEDDNVTITCKEFPEGSEMTLLRELSIKFNFKLNFHIPLGSNKYGAILPNGTRVGGMFGAISTGVADMASCSLWLTSRQSAGYALTYPHGRLCLTFVVPRGENFFKWSSIFSSLSITLWITIFVTIFLAGGISVLGRKIASRGKKEIGINIVFYGALQMYGVFLYSYNFPSARKHLSTRIIVLVWSTGCLLLSAAYSSKLVTRLTVGTPEKEIDTLWDMVENDIAWGLPHKPTFIPDLFNLENPCHRMVAESFVYENDSAIKYKNLLTRKYAIIGSQIDNYFFPRPASNNPANNDSIWSKFRVINECTSQFYISFAFRKYSPFLKPFDKMIEYVRETGLLSYWQKNAILRRRQWDFKSSAKGQLTNTGIQGALTLDHLKGAFLSLGIGLIFSFLCFIIELKYSFI